MTKTKTKTKKRRLTRIFVSLPSVRTVLLSIPIPLPVPFFFSERRTCSGAERHCPWTVFGMSESVGSAEIEHLLDAVDG